MMHRIDFRGLENVKWHRVHSKYIEFPLYNIGFSFRFITLSEVHERVKSTFSPCFAWLSVAAATLPRFKPFAFSMHSRLPHNFFSSSFLFHSVLLSHQTKKHRKRHQTYFETISVWPHKNSHLRRPNTFVRTHSSNRTHLIRSNKIYRINDIKCPFS